MLEKKVWIILAAVLGTLVLLLVVTLVLFCWQRSKRRMRGFSLRAATPLDDAEFESWRRPNKYAKGSEMSGIRPIQPVIVRSSKTPNMFEKEINFSEPPRTPSPEGPIASPKFASTSIRKPERVRRISSVSSSLADRPPTPYSPTSRSSDFMSRGSHSSRQSGSTPYGHYPSMSDSSNFTFNLDPEFGSPPRTTRFGRHSEDRPLSHSFAPLGESV
jgi:hypothetical protein